MKKVSSYELARYFHDELERLGQEFGFKMAEHQKFSDVPMNKQQLMIEASASVLKWLEKGQDNG